MAAHAVLRASDSMHSLDMHLGNITTWFWSKPPVGNSYGVQGLARRMSCLHTCFDHELPPGITRSLPPHHEVWRGRARRPISGAMGDELDKLMLESCLSNTLDHTNLLVAAGVCAPCEEPQMDALC